MYILEIKNSFLKITKSNWYKHQCWNRCYPHCRSEQLQNSVAEVKFNIKKAVVSADTITYNKLVEGKDTQEASAYKNAVGLVVKAKNAKGKEFTLTEGTDYTVSYSIGTDSDGDSAVKTVIKLKDDGNMY